MIGQQFAAPLNHGDFIEGEVVAYNDDTGEVEIKTQEGDIYKGYEYQLETIV